MSDRKEVTDLLAKNFQCALCGEQGGRVEEHVLRGQHGFYFREYAYFFVSCLNCGNAQMFNIQLLENNGNADALLKDLFQK